MSDLDGLKKVLRSLVVSSPTTMDAASLLRDYRRTLGEALPAARYGYRDPVLFLRERCGDSFLFNGSQTNPVLTLIVPDSIKHIDQFVQSQKSSSKQIKGKRRSVPESIVKKPQANLITSTFTRVPPKVEEHNRTTPRHTNKPTYLERKPESEAPRLDRTISVNRSFTETKKPDAPVTNPVRPIVKSQPDANHIQAEPSPPAQESASSGREEGAYSQQRLQRFLQKRMPAYREQLGSQESLKDDDSGRQTSSSLSSRSSAALVTLQAELVRLVAARPQGVWCSELLRLYEEEYGRELPFARFRYPSVSACACAVEQLTAVRAPEGDWLLRLRGEQEQPSVHPALRLRRAPRDAALSSHASRALLDPDDALPGIDYDPDVYPADCLSFLESIPAGSVSGLAPGHMLGVVVGEVYSPSHLWLLRLGPEHELMEQYMDEMTEYYNRGEGAERVLAAGARRPGQYCSSVFEDDWHRSLIVQLVDNDTVKVRHVDYGTVDTVRAAALRPLRRQWAALPAQAVRARLAGLRPAAASRRWPRAAAAHCLQLVREKRLVANVVAVDHEENILEVFLIDTSTEEDVNVTEQMIRAGHADPRPLPAIGAGDSYLLPHFRALETGATPNYAEIHALLRDGIALDYVASYRDHVARLLPSDSEPDQPEPDRSPSPGPPLAFADNRVPIALSSLRISPEPESEPESEPEPEPSPTPASTEASLTSEPSSPEPERQAELSAPALAPAPPPAPPPPPPPPPAPCCSGQPRAPHPASFYALPFCPCSSGACYPKPPVPVPVSLPLRYAPGYFRPRVSPQPAPHMYAQYPRPAVSVNYYPGPFMNAPLITNAPQIPPNLRPAQHPQNFVPNPGQNHQHFVPISAQNPQFFAPNSIQNQPILSLNPATKQQKFGLNPQNHKPSLPQNAVPSPTLIPQKFGPSPVPSTPNFGSSSSLNSVQIGASQVLANGVAGPEPVRLGAEECEFFELLSRVDPGAAHRFMIAALRRARGGDGAPPARPASASALNPHAVEFRAPDLRPPPGFENFIK